MSFRIGTTSYIYEDHILPNVRKLRGSVDDIELILFEYRDCGNIPTLEDLTELKDLADESDLTYTVHLPLDINLGDGPVSKRKGEIHRVAKLVNYFSALKPLAYILHLNLSKETDKDISAWRLNTSNSLEGLLSLIKVPPEDIAVENLHFPFHYVEDIVARNNVSVCVDIGHLNLLREDIFAHLLKHIKRTRVIHWHGILNGKDHLSLQHVQPEEIKAILDFLRQHQYRGVVTLEIFNRKDLDESLDCIQAKI